MPPPDNTTLSPSNRSAPGETPQTGDRIGWHAFADVEAGEGLVLFRIPPLVPDGSPCYGTVVYEAGIAVPEKQPLVPGSRIFLIQAWGGEHPLGGPPRA